MRKIISFLVITFFLLSACSQTSRISPTSDSNDAINATESLLQAVDTTANTEAQPESGQALQASATLTPAPSATQTQTPVPEPEYDSDNVGDLNQLDSYVISYKFLLQKGEAGGEVEGESITQGTRSVITKPWQVKDITSWTDSTTGEQRNSEIYRIGDAIYRFDEAEFWLIRPYQGNEIYIADRLQIVLAWIKSGRYAGQEVYQGIPANHFVFTQDDLALPEENRIEELVGNIWLAQDGNYLLHLDYQASGDLWREEDPGNSQEAVYSPANITVTFDTTSINQVQEIGLPPDIPTQVELETGIPLPPEVKLNDIMVHNNPPYNYTYSTSLTDDEILAYYASLQATNGWEVEMTAKDPDGQGGIVRLMNGGQGILMLISYYDYGQEYHLSFQYPAN